MNQPAPPTIGGSQRGSGGNVLSALLSFLIPGLGQLCQGRILAAVLVFLGSIMLWVMCFGWVGHIVAAVDAAVYSDSGKSKSNIVLALFFAAGLFAPFLFWGGFIPSILPRPTNSAPTTNVIFAPRAVALEAPPAPATPPIEPAPQKAAVEIDPPSKPEAAAPEPPKPAAAEPTAAPTNAPPADPPPRKVKVRF